ncbi:MAG: hypothetical protein ABIS03_11330 [Gemmatimonadaceae bacterium]
MTARTTESIADQDWPSSAHAAGRYIAARIAGSHQVPGVSLDVDRSARADKMPAMHLPVVVEDGPFAAVRVAEAGAPRQDSSFRGFLDGTQDARVVGQANGVPIIWGTVAAAVRVRVDRRLVSWPGHDPIVERRFYLPFRYVTGAVDDLRSQALVSDTTSGDLSRQVPSRHPAALMEAAMDGVQRDRERVETRLAEAWCTAESDPLYIDGGISASATLSQSPLAVGVIKSHRQLHADGDAFPVLVGLAAGERTSLFLIGSEKRNRVISWYLRLRDASRRDALFGLVRVEAAESTTPARANEVSRWLMAEGSPLALPDSRWDKMAYGIRGTEEFLRAIA